MFASSVVSDGDAVGGGTDLEGELNFIYRS
jgi:hypothetical protein